MPVDNCKGWTATYIRETETLQVLGQCTVSDRGHEVRLVPAFVEDAVDRVLVLDLVVDTQKSDGRTQTGKPVLYQRRTQPIPNGGGSPYEEVRIRNANIVMTVEEISERKV